MKLTPPGGTIRVSVRQDGATAICEVADTGQGIASTMVPRVFDLFAQGDAPPDHERGGLGVGLTLVRRLVEFHGGVVVADSPGIGRAGPSPFGCLPSRDLRRRMSGRPPRFPPRLAGSS